MAMAGRPPDRPDTGDGGLAVAGKGGLPDGLDFVLAGGDGVRDLGGNKAEGKKLAAAALRGNWDSSMISSLVTGFAVGLVGIGVAVGSVGPTFTFADGAVTAATAAAAAACCARLSCCCFSMLACSICIWRSCCCCCGPRITVGCSDWEDWPYAAAAACNMDRS